MINYVQMRQWRDICEYLDKRWYKFAQCDRQDSTIECRFFLLSPKAKPIRQELWTNYMVQLTQWGQHPYNFYYNDRDYRNVYGWRLLPGWEAKIDFVEKITLFNHNPDDLPQPWRRQIWEAVLNRENRIAQAQQERIERQHQIKIRQEEVLKAGNCPSQFDCRSMSGALIAGECPNFEGCKNFWHNL
jgi:hypothetical protein